MLEANILSNANLLTSTCFIIYDFLLSDDCFYKMFLLVANFLIYACANAFAFVIACLHYDIGTGFVTINSVTHGRHIQSSMVSLRLLKCKI